jgi:hypothetical protein
MSRRRRSISFGVAASAAWLAGCIGGPAVHPPEPPLPAANEALAVVGPPPAPSSYHARVVAPAPAEPPVVEQVKFPVAANVPAPVAAPPEAPPPPPPEAPLVSALRYVLDGRPSAAREMLQRCDPVSRDVLLALLQVAAPLGDGGLERATPQETVELLDQLNRLQTVLRQRAPLVIEKMCFCREIRDFGRFYPLPADYAFQTGSDGLPGELVQVYVEVRNVTCRPKGSGFETALKGHVEVHDFRGRAVWQHDFENRPDRSRTPLQDNYVEFHFNVPSGLQADAAYTLWVYVKDVEEDGVVKVARRSLDFRVRPPHRALPVAPESASAPR